VYYAQERANLRVLLHFFCESSNSPWMQLHIIIEKQDIFAILMHLLNTDLFQFDNTQAKVSYMVL
jgi:hypothetical protein